ncbi:hypothetical protein CNR22_20525 [Sphingobacteriaceae bacterium]|nr:hypothetical protein CNR22_20525 [Sphingobacteriaceae bacterium]
MKRKTPFFDLILLLFVFIIIAVSLLSFKRINDLIRSSDYVNHSNALVLRLEQVFSLIKDVETGQRGFLLTRDSSFLIPYHRALPKIPMLMYELDSLSKDNVIQHEKIKTLDKILALKIVHINSLISSPEWKANLKPVLKKGKILMDMIRYKVVEIEEIEQVLLAKRITVRDNYISITPAFSLSLITFTLAIIIVSFFKIRKDKSDIYRKNEELTGIKTYLQAILDSSSDIILTFDEHLNYTSINNAGEKYLQHTRSELIGKNAFDMYPQARNDQRHKYMLKALEGETNQIDVIATVVNENIKIQSTFIPLWIEGRIVGVLNLAKDITSLEKANETIRNTNDLLAQKNEELQEANNSLVSFNYIASHDLKEPLRKVQTFAKLLMDAENEKLSDNGKHYLDRMVSSTARMQALIEALMDFSKTHVTNVHFQPVDLNVIFDELRKEYKDALEKIRGSMDYQKLPVIKGAAPLISQLFSNLISNAIKYSKKNEPLKITIAFDKVNDVTIQGKLYKKAYWKFVVQDNGIGFNQNYAEKVFELFQRLHSSSKNYEGTGIGLTICKKLVQNHKGFIYAESEPNVGSKFVVFIPEEL